MLCIVAFSDDTCTGVEPAMSLPEPALAAMMM